MTQQKILTIGQCAKICKVSPRIVSKWFDSGRLKGYRIPGSQDRRVPAEYLVKFLREHGMPVPQEIAEGEEPVAAEAEDTQGIPPHVQRVVEEYTELDGRIDRLGQFFKTQIFDGLDAAEKSRLEIQFHVMRAYAVILLQRLEAVGVTNLPSRAAS